MFVKNNATAIPHIAVYIDVGSSSKTKAFMTKNLAFDAYFDLFKPVLKQIVATAYEFPFKGRRTFTVDDVKIELDHPYHQNAIWATPHMVSVGVGEMISESVNKQKHTLGVDYVTQGVLFECALTMVLSALAAREQIVSRSTDPQLSETQRNKWAANLETINKQLERFKAYEPSIFLIPEQCIGIYDGNIYFHSPVQSSYLHFITPVSWSTAPVALTSAANDFKSRAVDIFKGVTGSAGSIDALQQLLESYGVGAHMGPTPWMRLPNQERFDFTITSGMLGFLKKHAQQVPAFGPLYLKSNYAGAHLSPKEMAGVIHDLCIKAGRLGLNTSFKVDDMLPTWYDALAAMYADRGVTATDITEVAALHAYWNGRVDFIGKDLTSVSIRDAEFIKRLQRALRTPRTKWPTDLQTATSLIAGPYIRVTLPSGVQERLEVKELQPNLYAGSLCKAIMNPNSPLVTEMMETMINIEALWITMMNPDVTREQMVRENESILRIGGLTRMLANQLHYACMSPRPVLIQPVRVS